MPRWPLASIRFRSVVTKASKESHGCDCGGKGEPCQVSRRRKRRTECREQRQRCWWLCPGPNCCCCPYSTTSTWSKNIHCLMDQLCGSDKMEPCPPPV